MAKAGPKHGKPDVWASSISGYLAGEDSCLFKSWYQARHWVRSKGDFDKAAWIADHAVLLRARQQELVTAGVQVSIEDQNAFTLFGKSAKLTGKPDIVAIEDDPSVLVSDAKTGSRKLADRQQVLLYMYALPKVRPDFAGKTLRGELVYKDGRVEIGPQELTEEVVKQIGDTMQQIGFAMPPLKAPSERECGFCKLSPEDCPEKGRMGGTRAEAETSDF